MANNRLIEGPSLANPIIRQYVADAAITAGSWVSLDGADREVNPTVAATTVITGLAQSGAAEGGIVEVLIPQPGDIFQGTYTGTLAATDIGEACDITDAGSINGDASSTDMVLIDNYNATTVLVKYSVNPTKLTVPGGSAII
jgi:hypothetical protein